jgi:hypothetical protein
MFAKSLFFSATSLDLPVSHEMKSAGCDDSGDAHPIELRRPRNHVERQHATCDVGASPMRTLKPSPARRALAAAILGMTASITSTGSFVVHAADESGAVVPDSPVSPEPSSAGPLTWHESYLAACAQARDERRALLIYFHGGANDAACRVFDEEVLHDDLLVLELDRCVLARIPLDAAIDWKGQRMVLLEHAAFAELQKRPGLAMVDLADTGGRHYGEVVSLLPFTATRQPTGRSIGVLLGLPAGSLTQRTMIYAVRMHAESPASTSGQFDPLLAAEAESHAAYQASVRVQGHQGWDQRFHRINASLGANLVAKEVCAESWRGEELVQAAEECVRSWRQSPGHWSGVSAAHPLYAYDIKRGDNGVWYATGIFAARR